MIQTCIAMALKRRNPEMTHLLKFARGNGIEEGMCE